MATAKPMPPQVAALFDGRFNLWLRAYVVDVINELDGNLQTVGGEVSDLTDEVALKAGTDHNHNLAGLIEKSYNSLTDVPALRTATAGTDGPTAVEISAVSCPSGADSIDRTTFNSTLSTMRTEINGLKDDINTLTAVHDELIDKLQAAGLMAS